MRSLRRLAARVLFSRLIFEFLQRWRIHLVKNVPFYPIPDTSELARRKDFWGKPSEMPGVNLEPEGQLQFLREVLPAYVPECNFPARATVVPHEYHTDNQRFGELSAAVLHAMVRRHTPRTIIETGSGFSTFVTARACQLNHESGHPAELLVIDPHPGDTVRKGFRGLGRLVVERVEKVGVELFLKLGAGDILFIDTTHVVKTGSDVCFLYLEVLPRLQPGVLVHIHDIFFPFDYPRQWVVDQRHFFSEQYLLQAFLAHNRDYQVIWCESYMYWKHAGELDAVIPGLSKRLERTMASSFWMKRIR